MTERAHLQGIIATNIWIPEHLTVNYVMKNRTSGRKWFTLKFMHKEDPQADQPKSRRTLKSLVNTPLKRLMFGIQILSYILIVGSPAIGGLTGRFLDLKTGQTAGVILGVFITGEILFYGSLAFLGKELLLLLRDLMKSWFTLKRK